MPEPRTRDNLLGVYILTDEVIRPLPEEVTKRRCADEAERGTRFRKLCGMLGLRAAVHEDGTLDITIGITKGVMPWSGSG